MTNWPKDDSTRGYLIGYAGNELEAMAELESSMTRAKS